VSILDLGEGVFEVKATNGDNHLGGDNFDKAVVDWMVAEFKKDQGIDLAADRMALQRLYEAAEKAKIELSSTMTTQINLPFITATQDGPKHLDLQLTRAKLERSRPTCSGALSARRGRRSRTPASTNRRSTTSCSSGHDPHACLQAKVKELIGKDPHKGVNPERGRRSRRRDPGRRAQGRGQGHPPARRHALSLGIETKGGVFTP